jgi:hypothetical protein
MQLFALTDREPGMFAIAKRLWQGIKAQHITVKGAVIGGPAQVTGAGLNTTGALCSLQCSAQVFLRPLATSSIKRKSSQPTSSMEADPSAIVPALTSIRSCQRRAKSLRVATLITGTWASP